MFHVFPEVFADLFVVVLSLICDLNHKFKLILRAPMITGFPFPERSYIFEDHALGYSIQEVSRYIENLSTPATCAIFCVFHHSLNREMTNFL